MSQARHHLNAEQKMRQNERKSHKLGLVTETPSANANCRPVGNSEERIHPVIIKDDAHVIMGAYW